MQHVRVELLLLQLCVLAAADFVYVTDLPIFTSLALCAQYAVSNQVQGLTDSSCPQAVTALASCACSQDDNSVSVASGISTDVLQNCDATDTEDIASASAVFNRQAATVFFLRIFAANFQQLLQPSKPRACCHARTNVGLPISYRSIRVFEFGSSFYPSF
jgi:hypothetical protein